MKKNIFLFAMICNLFAPPKEKVVREIVTEWQEPPEDIAKDKKYQIWWQALNVNDSDSPFPCNLDIDDRKIMVNKKGQIRDLTNDELRRFLTTREKIRGIND